MELLALVLGLVRKNVHVLRDTSGMLTLIFVGRTVLKFHGLKRLDLMQIHAFVTITVTGMEYNACLIVIQ